MTKITNLMKSLMPSVIGVRIPNRNKAGPILICTNASILLSQRLTKPVKTRTTKISIIKMIIISILNKNVVYSIILNDFFNGFYNSVVIFCLFCLYMNMRIIFFVFFICNKIK